MNTYISPELKDNYTLPSLGKNHTLPDNEVIKAVVYKIFMDTDKPLWEEVESFYAWYSMDININQLENELEEEIKTKEILSYKRIEDSELEKRFFDISPTFSISIKKEYK